MKEGAPPATAAASAEQQPAAATPASRAAECERLLLQVVDDGLTAGAAASEAGNFEAAQSALQHGYGIASTCGFSCPVLAPPEMHMESPELDRLRAVCERPCVLFENREDGRWQYRSSSLTRRYAELLVELAWVWFKLGHVDAWGGNNLCTAWRVDPHITESIAGRMRREPQWLHLLSAEQKRCSVEGGWSTALEFEPGSCQVETDAARSKRLEQYLDEMGDRAAQE